MGLQIMIIQYFILIQLYQMNKYFKIKKVILNNLLMYNIIKIIPTET